MITSLKNLFVRMFDPNPATRITIGDIKQHSWYSKLPWGNHWYSGFYSSCFVHSMYCIQEEMSNEKKKKENDNAKNGQTRKPVSEDNVQNVCCVYLFCN